MHPLVLEGRVEGFRPRVCPAHPVAADIHSHPLFFRWSENCRGVVTASVGVEYRNPPAVRGPTYHHVDGVTDQVGTHTVGPHVANDLPRAAAWHRSGTPEPGHVRLQVISLTHFHPGRSTCEVAKHENRALVHVVGQDGGASLPVQLRGRQTMLAHDSALRVLADHGTWRHQGTCFLHRT